MQSFDFMLLNLTQEGINDLYSNSLYRVSPGYIHLTCHVHEKSMKNLIYHFPTCCAYSVKKPIGELNLKRAFG